MYIHSYTYIYIYIYTRGGAENLSRSSAFVHRLRGNADFSWAQPICHCASFWMKKMTSKYTLLSSGYLMCAENEGPSKMSHFFWNSIQITRFPLKVPSGPCLHPECKKEFLMGPDGSLVGPSGPRWVPGRLSWVPSGPQWVADGSCVVWMRPGAHESLASGYHSRLAPTAGQCWD